MGRLGLMVFESLPPLRVYLQFGVALCPLPHAMLPILIEFVYFICIFYFLFLYRFIFKKTIIFKTI